MKTKKTKMLAMTLVACLLVCMGAMVSSFASQETQEEKPDYDLVALAEAVEKYDDVWTFSEGLAKVKRNGKWGFINTKGEEVIPCKYDDIYYHSNGNRVYFLDGLALVRIGDKCGFVDKEGNDTFSVSREAKEKE